MAPKLFRFVVFMLMVTPVWSQVAEKPAGAAVPRRVTVVVSATDRSGNPVRDLAKDQVSVTENNQRAETFDVRSVANAPLTLGIVLTSSKTSFAQQQAAAVELAKKLVRSSQDRAFVVAAGGDRPWAGDKLEWQNEPAAMEKTIRALDKNTGLPDAFRFRISQWDSGTGALVEFQDDGFSVFDAAWAMMNSDRRVARRVLVIFRDPWMHSPGWDQRQREMVEQRLARIVTAAQVLHIAVHTIGFEDPNELTAANNSMKDAYIPTISGSDEGGRKRVIDQAIKRNMEVAYSAGRANLERLGSDTGGRVWWAKKKNFADAVAGIINELNGQYALTFIPAAGVAPGGHVISVSLSRKDDHISAPKAYFVGQPQAPKGEPAR